MIILLKGKKVMWFQ